MGKMRNASIMLVENTERKKKGIGMNGGNMKLDFKETGCDDVDWINLKTTIFYVLTPYSSDTARCFGRTYGLHLQGRRLSQERNQQKQVESCNKEDRVFHCQWLGNFRSNTDLSSSLHGPVTRSCKHGNEPLCD
jgi:hypothetical protein